MFGCLGFVLCFAKSDRKLCLVPVAAGDQQRCSGNKADASS